jgi:replication-associated recombination protein RarA
MESYLWVEQYRPKDVGSCILPKNLKDTFTEFVESNNVPNLILSGGPGVGKTTVAKAMLDHIGATYMMTLLLLYHLKVAENI